MTQCVATRCAWCWRLSRRSREASTRLPDEEMLGVLAKELKTRRESVDTFKAGGRPTSCQRRGAIAVGRSSCPSRCLCPSCGRWWSRHRPKPARRPARHGQGDGLLSRRLGPCRRQVRQQLVTQRCRPRHRIVTTPRDEGVARTNWLRVGRRDAVKLVAAAFRRCPRPAAGVVDDLAL